MKMARLRPLQRPDALKAFEHSMRALLASVKQDGGYARRDELDAISVHAI